MWGRGVIRLVKRMERVHSYALKWITGTFHTSPIGSHELVAGIPPLKIILNMRLQGMTARLLSLGEHHSLSRSWTLRWIPNAIAHVTPRRRARHLPTDNPLLRLSAPTVKEQFMPFHPLSRPGERGANVFSDRLFFDLSAPKRSSKFFATWVRDLKVKIDVLKKSGCSIIFSDGAYWSKTARSSYAFTAFHNNTWVDHYGWCPAGSSFDSELAALEEAIQWAVVHRISNPIFLVDNKAVLTTFLDLTTHSSQMSSIRINALIHDFLSTTTHNMSFGYCPSHVGIDGNERADRLTKTGAAMGPTPPARMLRSNFINDFKREMTTHWRVLSLSQSTKATIGSQYAGSGGCLSLALVVNQQNDSSYLWQAMTLRPSAAWPAPSLDTPQRANIVNDFTLTSPLIASTADHPPSIRAPISSFLALCTLHLPLHLLIGNTIG